MAKSQPKIVQVAAHYPPFLGGVEVVVYRIATNLAQRSYDIEVVTSDIGYRESFQDERIPGYKVNRLRAFVIANLPVLPGLAWKLLRMPSRSIFHVHVAQAFIPEVVFLTAKLRRAKCIVHFHLDVESSGRFGFLFNLYKKVIFPKMLRSVDWVIVFSEDQKKLVMKKYGVVDAKIVIIPNGVDESFFQAAKRTLPGRPKLLFAGRLSPQKNIQQLLYALEGISDKFETIIVGEGELKPELLSLSYKLNLKNVHFIGRADTEKMHQLYKEADIFVLPSIREGMPLVLLEAMASGLPIVATDVLGNRDLVINNHNGLLVPLHDANALREALLKLKQDTRLYALSSRHAYHTATRYSWDTVIASLEELYRA